MQVYRLLVERHQHVQFQGNSQHLAAFYPDPEKVMPSPYPALVVLVGEDMETPVGQRFRQYHAYGLYALPRLPADQDIEIECHVTP